MIYFNSMSKIAQMSRANWCRLLGLSYEEFEILAVKNPPIDDQTKNLLIAIDMFQKTDNLTAYINKCSRNYFIKKDVDLIPIKSLADKYCIICDKPLQSNRAMREYCSINCKQKAYRKRVKIKNSLALH